MPNLSIANVSQNGTTVTVTGTAGLNDPVNGDLTFVGGGAPINAQDTANGTTGAYTLTFPNVGSDDYSVVVTVPGKARVYMVDNAVFVFGVKGPEPVGGVDTVTVHGTAPQGAEVECILLNRVTGDRLSKRVTAGQTGSWQAVFPDLLWQKFTVRAVGVS